MEEILNTIGQYGGAPAVMLTGITVIFWKYVWPPIKKSTKDAAKREERLARIIVRNNCILKATAQALQNAGVEITIPEIGEDEL